MVVGEHAVKAAQKAYRECEGDSTESHRAALTAALPHLPGVGVKVKPLEWEGYGHWSNGPDEGWMEEANTAFGWGYSIEFGREGNFKVDSSFGWSQDGFDTPDEAKAAAQADYEARILSALEPSAARELALEEAARSLIAVRYHTYKARNGKLCSIEGDDGEKAWIVPFDAMADLESALSSPDHADAGKVEGDGSAAARDVLAERKRQVEAEGWTPEHDDKHSSGQLAYAASVYALCAASSDADRSVMDEFRTYNSVPFRIRNRWPWDESWLKPTNRRRDLVKAAALILAEIERLDRKASEGGSNV